ncbi:alpha/beta hydrolase [Aquamicrobium sp. LC103]|uniref:alpha/beta fold hydrolase n=1 Tax=Aquamicrobium sp. LC103 TaxID=1120658 RepID=UPI00063EADC0|nr:alpha/beta hydrolase [Aquamicrobium sp. LC103]TKT69417.1 alpha/beta hydrolase [Aquamicrobium sp. LC103]
MRTINATRHHATKIDGVNLFYREAGNRGAPGLLLLHGQPCSSFYFRHVIGPLSEVAHVVAPDLPGFGFTEAPEDYSYTFDAMAETIDALLREVGMDRFFLYVHDFGSPVAYSLAMKYPERVLGLIIQNGNAHEEGLGEPWNLVKSYWADPTPENLAKIPEWLNFEGVKHTYVGDIPERLVPLVAPDGWHLDWERMSQPGRIDIQLRIFSDYSSHVARFPACEAYHRDHQPPALLLWGRHDPYYEIAEANAYARDLDRIDMHFYDGTHLLLETHHEECARMMRNFIVDVQRDNEVS